MDNEKHPEELLVDLMLKIRKDCRESLQRKHRYIEPILAQQYLKKIDEITLAMGFHNG